MQSLTTFESRPVYFFPRRLVAFAVTVDANIVWAYVGTDFALPSAASINNVEVLPTREDTFGISWPAKTDIIFGAYS